MPGKDWHAACHVTWERVRTSRIEADEPGITLEEAASFSGRNLSTLAKAMAAGRLAVTHPANPRGVQGKSQVNLAD
jgi:hypothetical protein